MIQINRNKGIALIIGAALLWLLSGPAFNSRLESQTTNACSESWQENYKYLKLASSELSSNFFRPEEYLSNAYAFAIPWTTSSEECFRLNPSREYLSKFVAVLWEYERQLKLGARPIAPELPFKTLPDGNVEPLVVFRCDGWVFKSKEEKCKILFNVPYDGSYRIID